MLLLFFATPVWFTRRLAQNTYQAYWQEIKESSGTLPKPVKQVSIRFPDCAILLGRIARTTHCCVARIWWGALFWWRESVFVFYFLLVLLGNLHGRSIQLPSFCKKLHPPFDFRENSSSFDFWENPFKTPKENQKNCFSFAPCVFWICFRGLFALVPLDLNFTNPKSTIFEPGWKTQPLPANHDQITK